MKRLFAFLSAAVLLLASAQAQNLIVNGDFETGELTPWTGGTVVADPAGGFLATTAVLLSQTVATVPGQRYLVTADASSSLIGTTAQLTARPAAGGPADGTRAIGSTLPGFPSPPVILMFSASSTSTIIEFTVTSVVGPASLAVDDVTMLAIEPSRFTGLYGGTITTTLAVTQPEVSTKFSRKLTARITDDARIVILDSNGAIIPGLLLNDGSFVVNASSFAPSAGTAKIRGRRIEMQFSGTPVLAATIDGEPLDTSVTFKLVLTRRGK